VKEGVVMFPYIIKELRLKNNFTQQEVAERIGITRPAYTAYELGKREPDFNTLRILADLFGVSTDFLLGRSPQKSYSKNGTLVAEVIDDTFADEDVKEILSFIDYLKNKSDKKKTID